MKDHSEPPRLPARSVMNRVAPFEWNQAEAVRYEVALEVFSQEIAACTGRIYAERAKATPDQGVIDTCQGAITRLTRERQELDSNDQAAIGQVLDGARERIAAWRQM